MEKAHHTFLNQSVDYPLAVRGQLRNCLEGLNLPGLSVISGKVRDGYDIKNNQRVLITTDRQSAFDRVLAAIPFKGQVLNQTSAWWFEQCQPIIDNAVVAVPDPNVTVARKCEVFPIEFIVRGYITGSTNTALWTQYKAGVRNYCGHVLPDGWVKNQQLPHALITPTTKETAHDRPIAPEEIIAEGWMSQSDWEQCAEAALKLFAFGQATAARNGLILVDTKYEMGRDEAGRIVLLDEVHTPDSSRYWLKTSYASRFEQSLEPENIDKEFLRLWFQEHCDPYKDTVLPEAPEELVVELSLRYIYLFEKITGQPFAFPDPDEPIGERIRGNLHAYL